MKQNWPTGVTWLALGVLSLLIINLTRTVTTLQQWEFLSTLPLSAPPQYLLTSGLIWSILPLPVLWGLLGGKKWAPNAVKALSTLYGLFFWLEQWLVKINPLRTTNWLFSFVITIVLLFLVFWIPSREAVKNFFGENHERKSEN
jgi:hypothetical protein